MKPRFFETAAEFRAWLETNHETASELLLGFYKGKARAKKVGLTYAEALDEALCFGWIDAVRKTLDEERWTIRFTPRKAKSIWSAVNVARVAVLTKEKRMRPRGIAAFEARDPARMNRYSYEKKEAATLDPAYQARLKADKKAWAFLQAQAPWYQRTITHWVMSAKKDETRERRLATVIATSAKGERVGQFSYRAGGGGKQP